MQPVNIINTSMPSEVTMSLQQTSVMDNEKLPEQPTKNEPTSETKILSSHSSDKKKADDSENPALEDEDAPILINSEYERTSSFLPDTTFSDQTSEGDGGFFIEDNNQDDDDDDADVHVHVENADTKQDATGEKKSDFNDVSKAQQEESDETCDETAQLSTSTAASFPTKSILKADVEEIPEIPINIKKSKWKKLPAPDMEYVKMKRIESLNSIASSHNASTPDLTALNISSSDDHQLSLENQPVPTKSAPPPESLPKPTTTTTKTTTTPVLKKQDSKVQFQHIVVREYAQTIGDNPSVGYGTPICLDWEYQENEPLDVDLYEGNRQNRRTIRQMHLNSYQRKNIFVHKYGFSEKEVKAAKKATNKVRSQREWSKMMHTSLQPFLILEEMRESAVRKFKRYRGRNSSTSTNDTECESTIWIENRKKQQQQQQQETEEQNMSENNNNTSGEVVEQQQQQQETDVVEKDPPKN